MIIRVSIRVVLVGDLKIKIQQDLKEAQLKRDEVLVSTLRLLLAAIGNKEIEKRTRFHRDFGGQAKLSENELIKKLEESSKLTEEEILEVISSEVKRRKEAILEYEKGERQDLADKEKKEAEILGKYLPTREAGTRLAEEDIKKIVEDIIKKVGAKEIKDMGKVMAELMPKVKGKADGNLVSKVVKESLS